LIWLGSILGIAAFSFAVCSFIDTTIDSATFAGALMKDSLGLDCGGSITVPRIAGIGAKASSKSGLANDRFGVTKRSFVAPNLDVAPVGDLVDRSNSRRESRSHPYTVYKFF
jgi:hypothetical protein